MVKQRWITQFTAGRRAVLRRFVPLAWRRAVVDQLREFSTRKRARPAIERVVSNTRFPDVFVFAGVGEERAAAGLPDTQRRFFYFSARQNNQPTEDEGLGALEMLIHEQAVEEAVCIVQHPVWEQVALSLRKCYGWKLIVDAGAIDKAKEADALTMIGAKERLLTASDMVLTSTQDANDQGKRAPLWDRIDQLYGQVSIIVVSYNGLDLIRRCIDSILERTIYPRYEIIVVDNASTPKVRAYLRDLERVEKRVRVIFNATNKGFAAANNIGLQQARGSEFVVLLNNDTVVPRGWLCRLLRYVRRPDVGMVGPVTNWTGNEARIDVDYTDLKDMQDFARTWTYANEGKCFDIRVAAMFCVGMRKAVTDQVGPLDERFGLGMFEDEDYARRMQQAGYRVICAEDVFVHHYGMASFSKLADAEYRELFERNKRLYEEKWGEPWVPHQSRTQ